MKGGQGPAWDLDHAKPMKGSASREILWLIRQLQAEGRI